MRCWLLPACVCLAFLAVGCGEPPDKELNQAQGAIDAARAAGADRYAATELTAATDALTRAQQAVRERDYRLALNDALESRERAQNAAREAADTRARVRGEIERLIAEVQALVAQAGTLLDSAERARIPRRALREHQQTVNTAQASLQEASTALANGDDRSARTTLTATKERMVSAIGALQTLTTPQTPRRRR